MLQEVSLKRFTICLLKLAFQKITLAGAPVSPSVTHEAAPPSFGSVAPYTLAAEVKEFPSGFSIQEHITKAPKPLLSTTGTAQGKHYLAHKQPLTMGRAKFLCGYSF